MSSQTPSAAAPRAYQAAIVADPGNFLPYLGYGQWLLRRRDAGQATPWLERAVALNPTHGPAHFYLGLAYLEQGLVKQAAAQFQHSDVVPSRLAEKAGSLTWQFPDWIRAERYYRVAVVLSPEELNLWESLASFYTHWTKDYDKALATWQAAARALPASATPHRKTAELLWNHWHDTPRALGELEEALRLAPDDVETYLLAAGILREEGDLVAAETWLQRATEVAPASGEAHFRLGDLYLDQGRAPQAILALWAATAVAPDVARYYARLAQALQAMGLLEEAIQAAEAAAGLEPDEPARQRLLAELYRQAGQPVQALAAYRRVLELVPDDAQAQKALQALEGTTD